VADDRAIINAASEARVCLDFGTAFSKASVRIAGLARPLAIGAAANSDHPFLTPSVMFVDDGRITFGPMALARAQIAVSGRDPILSFKTILAARDLEQALTLKVKPSIDPTGTLRQRDALILYLAYLDQLIRTALHSDPALADAGPTERRRYTSPIWRTHVEGDRVMGRLFDEAAIVSADLGALLTAPNGVSIAHARAALDKAETALGLGQLESGVFEAHAAAAAYAAFAQAPKRFLLVFDMGAGTTDFAGFERLGGDDQLLSEIAEARQSCGLAGDEIDDIIAHLMMAKLKSKQRDVQSDVWRALRLHVRDFKKELFEAGRCAFSGYGVKLQLKRRELLASSRFKDYVSALTAIAATSVKAVAVRARAASSPEITILLAGGGANLSFLAPLAQAAAKQGDPSVAAVVERFGIDWRLPAGVDSRLASVMPQVAISLGGALADLDRGGHPVAG